MGKPWSRHKGVHRNEGRHATDTGRRAASGVKADGLILDERLPDTWDGRPIRWLDRWRPPLDFLCDGNRLVRDVRCPGGTIPHLWRPWWTRGVSDGTRLDIERCAACGYTLLVETRDDGTALEWELDETDYRNDNRKGKR